MTGGWVPSRFGFLRVTQSRAVAAVRAGVTQGDAKLSPLFVSSAKGFVDIVNLLLGSGARVNAANEVRWWRPSCPG